MGLSPTLHILLGGLALGGTRAPWKPPLCSGDRARGADVLTGCAGRLRNLLIQRSVNLTTLNDHNTSSSMINFSPIIPNLRAYAIIPLPERPPCSLS